MLFLEWLVGYHHLLHNIQYIFLSSNIHYIGHNIEPFQIHSLLYLFIFILNISIFIFLLLLSINP